MSHLFKIFFLKDALAEEWKKLLDSQVNEWKDKIHSLGIKDDERLQITQDIFDKCEQELDELRRQKANEHSKLRNELENDIQVQPIIRD